MVRRPVQPMEQKVLKLIIDVQNVQRKKEELSQLSEMFAPRLQPQMRSIFKKVKQMTSLTSGMSLIWDFGLHFMKHKQKIQQAYRQTNLKNSDPQIICIDKNQAIAHIRMFIHLFDEQLSKAASAEDLTDGCEPLSKPTCSEGKYALGSPLPKISVEVLEHEILSSSGYHSFGERLRQFLGNVLDSDSCSGAYMKITPYQCLYLTPRYDYVVIITVPLAAKDKLRGCMVLEEKGYTFVLLKYLIWSCHLIPTSDKDKGNYYLNDLIDNDAFLRF
ncbi:hypothetical protein M422DRAFT_262067 [Sphaerobolus stellatus SS14]|uniref:Uncharacterized protein n=1 Tax=Sphaerobolus stellatus (strain SS14) TaxID=990650 RepID=A0A0C9VE20_SPHS4|nr:hypothetical protein M422DRAFT_262067 [Sphaerobolus stellatus SS14]